MGVSDFLLELRSEEIPARMQARARDDLARLFAEQLDAANQFVSEHTVTYATPRRLVLISPNLPAITSGLQVELKGPRTTAPAAALDGFMRKNGLSRDQMSEHQGVWFANIERPGRPMIDVLGEAIPAVIRGFPWPKSMRWGAASMYTESLRWVRPLHGIVALLGDEIIPFEIAGIVSGATTLGHRFHHPGPITIGSAADYTAKLRACHVLIDPAEREVLIRTRAQALAADAGLELVPDEGLVTENAGLTEWPVPLLGRFDDAFLAVPPEVIQLTARVNQKYFVCRDKQGALANAFVCTANIEAIDGGAAIVEGNRKVLAARLADARFFYETDLKVPLDEQAKKLDRIVFHEKLGTVADKVERVAKLAEWLASEGIVPGCDPALARRAAELCKADLVTGMVGEFPELQGVMGGYYAAAQGENPQVAAAIRDHYKPIGQGDEVPTAPVTVAVSLADKLDSLLSLFAARERASGSRDPFGLRRSGLSIITICTSNGLRLSLSQATAQIAPSIIQQPIVTKLKSVPEYERMFALVWPEFPGVAPDGEINRRAESLKKSNPNLFVLHERYLRDDANMMFDLMSGVREGREQILTFLADRLKVQQREAGVRHDLIDAVFALGGEDDLVRLLARVHALQAFVGTHDGANLLAGYKRAANILKKEGWEAATSPLPTLSPKGERALAEIALITALDTAEPAAATAVAREDFEGAMTSLATLRAPIDRFFDDVIVNDPDPAIRAARLALLARVRDAMHTVADFSRIEG